MLVTSSDYDGSISIWDIEKTMKIDQINQNTDRVVLSFAELENGYLAHGHGDNTIKIWDLNASKLKYKFN